MLNVLGLQRTNFGSREIDLLFTNPSISQDHLLTQELTVQMAQSYGLLPEQAQEDALHSTRLLSVEERPFQRVTRNLLSKESLLRSLPDRQLPSPPPEGEEPPQPNAEDEAFKRQKFREDMLLDFAALESSILRIQLIQSSNQRERERYAAEKAKILETAQAVRDNTVELRTQLEDAQRMLELRKGYDELAGKILDDKKLRSRVDCQTEIDKLDKEIEDLQQESAEYETTWAGRREQFDKVVAEGEAMRRLIKGIKDEPEHADGDEDMEDGDDGTKGENSRMGTPAPDGRTPMREGGETPRPVSRDAGGATPARPVNRLLEVEDGTRAYSRATSPSRRQPGEAQADVEMAEPSLEAPPKTSTGMEASVNQVIQAAEGVTDKMDET